MSRPEEPARANAGGHGQRPASTLRSINLAVRLLCELALLAILALWGIQVGSGAAAKLTLGLGLPLLAAVAWGQLVAPASRRRLADPARLSVEILLFAAGTAALATVGYPLAAIVFAILVAANVTLDRVLA